MLVLQVDYLAFGCSQHQRFREICSCWFKAQNHAVRPIWCGGQWRSLCKYAAQTLGRAGHFWQFAIDCVESWPACLRFRRFARCFQYLSLLGYCNSFRLLDLVVNGLLVSHRHKPLDLRAHNTSLLPLGGLIWLVMAQISADLPEFGKYDLQQGWRWFEILIAHSPKRLNKDPINQVV